MKTVEYLRRPRRKKVGPGALLRREACLVCEGESPQSSDTEGQPRLLRVLKDLFKMLYTIFLNALEGFWNRFRWEVFRGGFF